MGRSRKDGGVLLVWPENERTCYLFPMAATIEILAEEVINQIAAGEVVENPASVVKELLENSLDAGALRLEVSLEEGGLREIRVEDDGKGMSEADLLLSVERHATSKLKRAEDVFSLKTMGFRGEALAAIASVSQMEITTSQGGTGARLFASLPGVWKKEPAARNRGTTVLVRSLFYNAPARRKFQKKGSILQAQALEVVETIALAHPECAFSVKADGAVLFSCEPEERRSRVEAVFGPFFKEVEASGLWALLSAPEEAKRQRRRQKLFINGRPVFSPLLAKAVEMGYGTRLPEGLHPPFVLFLEIPPHTVDVNVHPQKKEVRFREERTLFLQIEEAIARSFEARLSPVSFSFTQPEHTPFVFQERSFEPSSFFEESPSLPIAPLERPLWIEGHFLLLEREGLCLVDLKKAEAALLKKALLEERGKDLQALLLPLVVEVTEEEEEFFEGAGLPYTRVGRREIALEALPPFLREEDAASFFSLWKKEKSVERALRRHAPWRRYTLGEGMALWRALREKEIPPVDSEGGRIWKKVTKEDLEKTL